jgi:hypothetical protein
MISCLRLRETKMSKRGRPVGTPQIKGDTKAYHDWLLMRMGRLNAADLSRLTGMHYNVIAKIVSGETMPSMWSHILISKALGADLGEGLEELYGRKQKT